MELLQKRLAELARVLVEWANPARLYLLSNYLLNHVNQNETLLIQQEIVDLQRNIPETQAGKELRHNLLELLALQRAAESINLDDQDKKELTMRRRQVKDQMRNLELSWGDRFKKLFGLF
ncbi:hypothetical protein BKA70DRAFT_1238666 [Coprinopsis sp. MPI-PUGE-AT-0042]|nr:hypothetical protein BKA70DRAFT_1238666 [Coprinopsis sp. MPI-PUGE-AT-0042]